MFKKIKQKIFSFWLYFFKGLHQADRAAFGTKEEGLNSGAADEEKNEVNSVWADLLKGEITQAVKELRYETAHVDREAKKYKSDGGGRVSKRNTIFDYKGDAENSENYKIAIVQDNIHDINTVGEVVAENKNEKKYFFKFGQNFVPRYRLDEYIQKVVVKEIDKGENKYQIDLYTQDIKEEEKKNSFKKELYDLLENNDGKDFEDRDNYIQYSRTHKLFNAELERVYKGDRKSEIIDFNSFSFTTFQNTFGSDDGITYEYKDIVLYHGFYILKFECTLRTKKDSIDAVYDEIAERKFKNKENRETKKIDFGAEVEKVEKEMSDEDFYKKYCELIEANNIIINNKQEEK